MSISTISSGLYTIQQGYQRLNSAAGQIANNALPSAPTDPQASSQPGQSSLDKPLVELTQAVNQTQAGAQVIRAQDGAVGTLFDALA